MTAHSINVCLCKNKIPWVHILIKCAAHTFDAVGNFENE